MKIIRGQKFMLIKAKFLTLLMTGYICNEAKGFFLWGNKTVSVSMNTFPIARRAKTFRILKIC